MYKPDQRTFDLKLKGWILPPAPKSLEEARKSGNPNVRYPREKK
jgi:hypothetical protein